MELVPYTEPDKIEKAKKRVKELKGFYVHLLAYLVINAFISINKMVRNMYNGESLQEAFWDFGTFAVWIFWGIGIAHHVAKVFRYNPIFGKKWEERKIRELIHRDTEQNTFDR